MEYIKCHGTGNMFYIIDEYDKDNSDENSMSELTKRLCRFDENLDGVLFLVRGSKGTPKMRIFNSDGSEAEMCGNGLRCIGRYVFEKFHKEEFVMETLKTSYNIKVIPEGFLGMVEVSIEIDGITTDMKEIPLNIEGETFINKKLECLSNEQRYSAFSVTNPHLVSIFENVNKEYMEKQGKKIIEKKDVFPQGMNLSLLKKIAEDKVFVRTYERGVGFTKSCGTGMMSSVTNYCIKNPHLLGRKIHVFNDGGMVNITIDKLDEFSFAAKFEGNATYVEKGTINMTDDGVRIFKERIFSEEEESYKKLLQLKDNELR